MSKKINIGRFRDTWLDDFFTYATIPASIHTALARKMDIINAATSHKDLRSPRAIVMKRYPVNGRVTPQ